MSFHHLVRQAYLTIADVYKDRIVVIDGHQSIDAITNQIIDEIERQLHDTK